MTDFAKHSVDQLLSRIKAGDDTATTELLNSAYKDLRALAEMIFRAENTGHTLQPTALVNELCLKMLSAAPGTNAWEDRNHFFRTAAKAMRNLLTDHARAKKAQRRGGDARRVSLDSIASMDKAAPSGGVDLVALDDTLTKLASHDEELAATFELRFLAGLSAEQTATVSGKSLRTVERDCQFIRAWLQRELQA